ncbi:MAG: sulfatase-like hydrolase/transferase [Planctomycetaceae bacterium]|nr:sulfatase-like hydrolase/transferase [Planctomycetaceae bacterium]
MTRSLSPSGGAAGVLCVLGILLSGCNGGDEAENRPLKRPNIVLVTIDTLRADHLGCYGFYRDTTPRIDAFSKDALVFEQAYATMATTLPSHASMLTSRYPIEHGITANLMHGGKPFGWAGGMLSFAQVAKDAGYATAGFVSAAPLKVPSGIGAGFETWSEPKAAERKAGETLGDALPWIEQHAKEPFFLWIHFYDPHWPHRAPEPFDGMFDGLDDTAKKEAWIAERGIPERATRSNGKKDTETRWALDNYCEEVRYADDQFGRVIDALKAKGLYDKSVVVLTADHGEGLNQHDWTAHGLVWDEQLRVPLLMRFPAAAQVAPGRTDKLVSLIDLMPTVLGRVQPLETKKWRAFFENATGVDALAPDFKERPVFAQRTGRELATTDDGEPGEMYAITAREWKFIHEPTVAERLFDRAKDPFELRDISKQDPNSTAARLRDIERMMAEQRYRLSKLGPAGAGEMDPELQRQMNELGYADDGTGGGLAAPPPYEGPKDASGDAEPSEPKKPKAPKH